MKKFKIASICLGAALVSLVICGYTLRNKISVQAEVLTTKAECVAAFGKKGRRLFKSKKNKIYPIKCTIQNNGSSTISLSLENIDLKMVPRKTIMQKLAHSTWPRGFGILTSGLKILGVGAIVFAGSIVATVVGTLGIATAMVLYNAKSVAGLSMVLGSCLPIASLGVGAVAAPTAMVIYGYKLTQKTNKIFPLLLLDSLEIQPGETRTFFLFVYERDMQKNFSMKFIDENQNNLLYNVQLPSIVI